MSDQLFSAVERIARHAAAARSWASVGKVTDVHPTLPLGNDHAVSVELRDSGVMIPRVPISVGALGFAATPAVGDLVLVVFADGDPHAGVVVGRLYHRDLPPPKHAEGQLALQLPPDSTSPDIELLADPATPELTVRVGEATVAVQGRTVTITIGDSELLVDGNSPGALSITSGEASIKLRAGGEITIEAATKLELKAAEINIEGSGKVTVSGGLVEVN
jgi:phage baseplate assembly protein gpV